MTYYRSRLQVSETLRGSKPSNGIVDVEFFVARPDEWEAAPIIPPDEDVLLFLVRDRDLESYHLIDLQVGFFRERDGRVVVPSWAEEPWVTDLQGTDFARLVQAVQG